MTETELWYQIGYADGRRKLLPSSQGGDAYREGYQQGKAEVEEDCE